MKIILNINSYFSCFFEDIRLLTDKSKIKVNDIKYEETKKLINIPMKRKEIIGFKNNILCSRSKPIYDNNNINTLLTIKKIENIIIKNNCNNKLNEITVLFGLKINKNQYYLSSAEEIMGKPLLEIKIDVNEIDFELYDL